MTALMGLSALVGMLALEFLMTGQLNAAGEYAVIAVAITGGLVAAQWRHHRSCHGKPADSLRSLPRQEPLGETTPASLD